MNPLSLLRHPNAGAASPLAAPAAKTQGTKASITPEAAGSSSTSGSSGTSGTSSSGDTSSSASSSSITANDFLTLLVTEIQNQDPTSQTDPMTYITQLVGVNSLEQLVQINQTLTTATTPAITSSGSGTGTAEARSAAAHAAIAAAQSTTGPAAANGAHLLPLGVSGQASTASTNAVAQAFTHPEAAPQQPVPTTEVPLNPEVMRALQRSIPGAKQVGPSAGTQ